MQVLLPNILGLTCLSCGWSTKRKNTNFCYAYGYGVIYQSLPD